MKHMKKLASLVLALVMALALAVPAMAQEGEQPVRITAPDNERSYEVYQIFTGKLEDGVLSNVKWGENGTGSKGTSVDQTTLDALEAANSTGATDTSKLTVIEQYVNLESQAIGTITKGSYLDVAPGYYLIKDLGEVKDGESYSLYVVQLVGNVTITPKTSDTTLEKGVKDKNDSTGAETEYQPSADHDIGDVISYQLKATLGERVSDYKTYKVVFTDTMDPGLTFCDVKDVKVYVDGTDKTAQFEIKIDGQTMTVSCADVKAEAVGARNNSVITVEYTGTLNANAAVGNPGNKNTAKLEYSNNPNWNGEGEEPTGETPEKVAVVFTLKAVVNKTEKNPNYDPNEEGSKEYIPLKGAGFKLYKKNAETNEYELIGDEVKGEDMTTFVFSGLDDGDYRLEESTTPAGYNTIEDIYFTITADHDISGLTKLEGKNGDGEDVFTDELTAGTLTTDVENNKGATLPETGGIGTTIFYVAGGLLTAAAVVLLVTKKRMGAEDK